MAEHESINPRERISEASLRLQAALAVSRRIDAECFCRQCATWVAVELLEQALVAVEEVRRDT